MVSRGLKAFVLRGPSGGGVHWPQDPRVGILGSEHWGSEQYSSVVRVVQECKVQSEAHWSAHSVQCAVCIEIQLVQLECHSGTREGLVHWPSAQGGGNRCLLNRWSAPALHSLYNSPPSSSQSQNIISSCHRSSSSTFRITPRSCNLFPVNRLCAKGASIHKRGKGVN